MMLTTKLLLRPKMSVNGESTIFALASCIIQRQWNIGNPEWTHRQPLLEKMLVTISHPPPTIERPPSVNSFCGGPEHYKAMNCIVLFPDRVLRGQSLQSNLVYNLRNMHAMSYRSDFFTCSSRVNIWEPAVCFAVSLVWGVFRVGIPSWLIPTALSDQKSLNTSLLKVTISSKNEHVCISDLSDHTLQIISNAWWASMNVHSKLRIA